jgi:phosphoenolpyruvate carboxylase
MERDAHIPLPDRQPARLEMPYAVRRDIRLPGDLLGTVLVEAGGPELLESVEELRRDVIVARREPAAVARRATCVRAEAAPRASAASSYCSSR